MAINAELIQLRDSLSSFVLWRQNHLTGDEKGEAQVFLERLFIAFGHAGLHQAGATLEKRVAKRSGGGTSFADLVWRPRVLVEMKKGKEPLRRHYQQAFEYWIDLVPDRPEYVVLCNFDEFWIYDLNKQLDEPVDRVALVDLPRRWESLSFLLPTPIAPQFSNDLVAVTREAAATLVAATNSMIDRGVERTKAQRFAMQCLVAMVAEDVGLFPHHMFSAVLDDLVAGGSTYDLLFGLFREMDRPGNTPSGRFKGTPYFNGGLFRDIEPIDLTFEEITSLHDASSHDWTAVRPEIFGTLFEQSLGKSERHALGAHFTSGADIQRIVLPTIVRPWRERIDRATTGKQLGLLEQELLNYRVLDPACGSGNFLYIAYRELRKLERDIFDKRLALGLKGRGKKAPGATASLSFIQPGQFYGIDRDGFATEIAKVTLMLARQLAAVELGDEHTVLPLDDLDANFITGDALHITWPRFDVCIGNPPFVARRNMVRELGASYCAKLADTYPDIGGVSDYVAYWFRKSHDLLAPGGRAGLVGTNTIREVDTRKASLDYIVDNGGTFTDAWSSLPWSGDAAVHVSVVNWVKGDYNGPRTLWLDEGERKVELPEITGSLSEDLDLRSAVDLLANQKPKVFFQGQTPGHTKGFVLTDREAADLRRKDPRSASVLHPYIIGDELLHKGRPGRWVLDIDADDATSAKGQAPAAYERIRQLVLPHREQRAKEEAAGNAEAFADRPGARVNWHHRNFLSRWWQHSYRREDFLIAIARLDRYIVISRVASELRLPVFVFVEPAIRASDATQGFALADDYSFGILQSTTHELWFRGRCSTLEERLRYTSKTVFNTFPWPQNPSPTSVKAVVAAVVDIHAVRQRHINAGLSLAQMYDSLREPGVNDLRKAHKQLDEAVLVAYGFDKRRDILPQLLAINHACAALEGRGEPVRGPGATGLGETRRTDYRIVSPLV
jgi:hypothetical protein